LEHYLESVKDWHGLWFQFGGAPGRQHPVFYIRPGEIAYELGWNRGPAKESQLILATIIGDRGHGGPRMASGQLATGQVHLGLSAEYMAWSDAGAERGVVRREAMELCGLLGENHLGFYIEACRVEVEVRV
jgi:hypothetical protein